MTKLNAIREQAICLQRALHIMEIIPEGKASKDSTIVIATLVRRINTSEEMIRTGDRQTIAYICKNRVHLNIISKAKMTLRRRCAVSGWMPYKRNLTDVTNGEDSDVDDVHYWMMMMMIVNIRHFSLTKGKNFWKKTYKGAFAEQNLG